MPQAAPAPAPPATAGPSRATQPGDHLQGSTFISDSSQRDEREPSNLNKPKQTSCTSQRRQGVQNPEDTSTPAQTQQHRSPAGGVAAPPHPAWRQGRCACSRSRGLPMSAPCPAAGLLLGGRQGQARSACRLLPAAVRQRWEHRRAGDPDLPWPCWGRGPLPTSARCHTARHHATEARRRRRAAHVCLPATAHVGRRCC